MSEHITHIAVFEDTTRFINQMNVSKDFQLAVKKAPDAGLISSGARGNHLFAIPIIEEAKSRKDNLSEDDFKKLAAAIGWLSHRAIDLQVKPNYLKSAEIKNPHFSTYEHQIYCDAVTFDEVYDSGSRPSISSNVAFSKATLEKDMQSHPGTKLLYQPLLEEILCRQTQHEMLAIRAFNRTSASIDDWLDDFPENYQKLSENLEVYIEAYQNPDPEKTKRYIKDWNFYNEKDELIQFVRDIQLSGKTKIDLDKAVKLAEEQSHYAQGLSRSYRFISAANEFYNDKIDKNEVYDRVEIFNESHRI
ncbi:hypothetical protein [Marinigracilibium pacificum]|uniref:Zinc dependent phospholipase C n=1 Tax=Marinigracilibium pacificum TaxID=2729599 RepID=A0A848IWA0_9BACT|nr:hypothetical protein [Marinigracilibium pacificum]NMM47555.1 hypothetical protein [Marinigracilibium pacificum]